MNESRRQKKASSLIKEEVSSLLGEMFHGKATAPILTVTRVEMSKDLKIARIYLSVFGPGYDEILMNLEEQSGYLRKCIASRIKLKYNPKLIFSLDKSPEYEERLEHLFDQIKKNEKR